jgi:peptide/nickel transport system ATP-binding protein
MTTPVLQVRHLRTSFGGGAREVVAVDDVSFEVGAGEVVGIVGESGCGKSVTAASILRLVPSPGRITGGEILFNGRDVLRMSKEELRQVRGSGAAMVFQDPMSSLNPVLSVGAQTEEAMVVHGVEKLAARRRAGDLLDKVRIPDARTRLADYPHQFSGGMRQRIMIAMGLANEPRLLIADEPTTALDVTVQAQILDLLRDLNRDTGTAIVLITHNIAVVAALCSRILVMYAGRIVEQGPTAQVLNNPQHPYTWSLLQAVPRLDSTRHSRLRTIEGLPPNLASSPTGCRFRPRCAFAQARCDSDPGLGAAPDGDAACWFGMDQLRARLPAATAIEPPRVRESAVGGEPLMRLAGVSKHFRLGSGITSSRNTVAAVDNVTFDVYPGETLGIVGESGCGKSTLARVLMQLEPATAGRVWFGGTELTGLPARQVRQYRREMQMVFQDSHASLDPRLTVAEIVGEPLRNFGVRDRRERRRRVVEVLDVCGLPASYADRYPHEFSGGQRQRVGIARALVLRPRLVVADEPISALDVSIQAQIVNLLQDLQAEFKLTYVFISHDLSVIRHIADRVAVMYLGKIVELSDAAQLYANPQHPYTRALLAAIPRLQDGSPAPADVSTVDAEIPSPLAPPTGCRFHPRCPIARLPLCAETEPELAARRTSTHVACHLVGVE